MHAETLASDHAAVRWVVSHGDLPSGDLPSGRLVSAPGRLGQLLSGGVLRTVLTEPCGVTMWLAPGGTWRSAGDDVRQALQSALAQLEHWVVDPDEDGTLQRIAQDVLAGPVGDYVRSHGGDVVVRDVSAGVLDVAFDGACSTCSASGVTLHDRLESAIRERYPRLRGVRDVGGCPSSRRPTLWPRLRRGSSQRGG